MKQMVIIKKYPLKLFSIYFCLSRIKYTNPGQLHEIRVNIEFDIWQNALAYYISYLKKAIFLGRFPERLSSPNGGLSILNICLIFLAKHE